MCSCAVAVCFFCCDPPTTEIYTLSLHDALPICNHDVDWTAEVFETLALANAKSDLAEQWFADGLSRPETQPFRVKTGLTDQDRKSTRLNSSHRCISYAVFCLKKKKNTYISHHLH